MDDQLDAVVVGGAGVDTNVGRSPGRGELLARHTCTLVAGDDGFLTRRELDERFAALRG